MIPFWSLNSFLPNLNDSQNIHLQKNMFYQLKAGLNPLSQSLTSTHHWQNSSQKASRHVTTFMLQNIKKKTCIKIWYSNKCLLPFSLTFLLLRVKKIIKKNFKSFFKTNLVAICNPIILQSPTPIRHAEDCIKTNSNAIRKISHAAGF